MCRLSIYILSCLTLFIMITGCSAKKSIVVLMPNPDGTVGEIEVSTKGGSRTVSSAGEAVEVTSSEKAPSEPVAMDEKKLNKTFGEVLAVEPVPPKKYILYFLSGTTELTTEARALIPEIISEIRSRPTEDISVIGHTDRLGSLEYNIMLSFKRAEALRSILVSKGVEEQNLILSSHGEDDPLIPTPDNVSEPRNRRVEIIIR